MTTVLDSDFSDYHSVRVCDEAFVGEKLKEITVECGFPNSSNFYRLYKKHTGESPRQGR